MKDIEMKNVDASPDSKPAETKGIDIPKSTLIGFTIAMALHSFIDGIAVGVFDEPGALWLLAASMIVHKIPVGFTFGFIFEQSDLPFCHGLTQTAMLLFILMPVLGLITGSQLASQDKLTMSIIQAISGGSFIYLACCDFLIHEF